MYKLTLTSEERQAIDWIGNRYSHGHDFWKLLWFECHIENDTIDGNGLDWDIGEDITFLIPENVASKIKELIDKDQLACFADPLASKLYDFVDCIV